MSGSGSPSPSRLSPLKNCRKGKGKRRIEIRKIEKKSSRQVCFSKRRQGLFKKAAELSTLCDVDVAVLVFSPAGNLFSSARPDSVDSVIRRFLGGGPAAPPSSDGRARIKINVEEMKKEEEELLLLQKLLSDLQETREKVLARVAKLKLSPPRPPSARVGPPQPEPLPHDDSLLRLAVAAVPSLHPDFADDDVKPPTLSQLNHGDGDGMQMMMESSFDDLGCAEDDELLLPFSDPGSQTIFDMFPPLDDFHCNCNFLF